jgi:CRISPR type III-B/RAMP module RAMP protein Cmr1
MSVITYRFATPCIISGADPSKAELRASSIRGGLRWWFEPWEVPRRMNGMYSEESAKAIKAAQALAE